MKKIVQKSTIWLVAVAVVLGSTGTSQAMKLEDIKIALGQTTGDNRGNVFSQVTNAPFVRKGSEAIQVNVIESTIRTSFGTTAGNKDSLYTFQRSGGSGNFAVLANGTAGSGFTDGGTANATTVSSASNGNGVNVAGTVRERSNGDIAAEKIGTNAIAPFGSAPVSTLVTLNKSDNDGFNFLLRTTAGISGNIGGDGEQGIISALGTKRYEQGALNSGFSAYLITAGADKGAYLIAFENLDSSKGEVFTFAAIVYGVVNPEPASIAMLSTGVLGLAGLWRRRRNAANAVVAAV